MLSERRCAMSCLYITENGAKVGIEGGRFSVKCKNGMDRYIPKESVDSIIIFGNVNLTVPCLRECMERGISVSLFSTTGRYFGRIESTSHINARRLRRQVHMSENEEDKLIFSKKIIENKIHNQRVLLTRYARNSDSNISDQVKAIKIHEKKIQ